MNVWISANGIKETPFVFPYEAQNPISGQIQTFKSVEDVEQVIDEILLEDTKVSAGQNLYFLTPLFCDQRYFVDSESQDFIRQYNFCKTFNTPLANTLDEIPAKIVEAFDTIEKELESVKRVNNG